MNFGVAGIITAALPIKVFIGLSLLFSEVTIAQENKDIIHISPRSCLIEKAEQPCEKEIVLNWRLSHSLNFCISTDKKQYLFCNGESHSGQEVLLSHLERTTTFIVTENQSGDILARIVVYVVTNKTQAQRRRYRHPWSIF